MVKVQDYQASMVLLSSHLEAQLLYWEMNRRLDNFLLYRQENHQLHARYHPQNNKTIRRLLVYKSTVHLLGKVWSRSPPNNQCSH